MDFLEIIRMLAALLVNPGVQQNVARAAVEAGYRLAGLDQAKVAETADIQDGVIAAAFAKQRFMKGGYQWRALATSGHVAAAEVADHSDACQLCEQGRVTDLYGKASGGFMADGLPVATDRANVLGLESLLLQ